MYAVRFECGMPDFVSDHVRKTGLMFGERQCARAEHPMLYVPAAHGTLDTTVTLTSRDELAAFLSASWAANPWCIDVDRHLQDDAFDPLVERWLFDALDPETFDTVPMRVLTWPGRSVNYYHAMWIRFDRQEDAFLFALRWMM